MTDRAMYPTRLYWDGHKGVARHDGVEVILHEMPYVGTCIGAIDAIEYAPGLHVYEIQPRGDRRRDMSDAERDEVWSVLVRMARIGQEHWGQR